MLKKLPTGKAFYLILILLLLALILTLAGQTIAGISTGALSLAVSIWKHLASEKSSQEQESLNQTQAKMLLKGGHGNLYIESIFDEIARTGRATDVRARLDKALAIEPENQFAMSYLAVSCSLSASLCAGRGWAIDPEIVRFTRALCQKGRQLYPNEPLFLDALGTLADSLGKHKTARVWFKQSSQVGEKGNPGWRLSTATSFALSGDHQAALEQLQLAKSEGLSIWILDFYLGRALCSLGRFDEALAYLHSARRERRLRTDIVIWIRVAHFCQLHLLKAAYYNCVFISLLLLSEPLYGLRLLPLAALYPLAIGYRRICRRLYWTMSAIWPSRRSRWERLFGPDMLEVDVVAHLAQDGNFRGAENVCRLGLQVVPESIRLITGLALSLAMQGHRDEAITELDKALVRFPNNEILLHNRNAILNEPKLNVRFIDARDTGNMKRS